MTKIFICAGEASGDYHGASLAKALFEQVPGVDIRGVGGAGMAREGVALSADIRRLGVMGLVELLPRLVDILRVKSQVEAEIAAWRPDAVVFIDFPGFNMRLALYCRRIGVRTVYFIPPKVWAWRQGRVRQLARDIDQMLVIFPFEADFYASHGLRAEYVGNPLLDGCTRQARRSSGDHPVIGLVPGSRRGEVNRLLPPMLDAVRRLRKTYPHARYLLPVASSVDQAFFADAVTLGVELEQRPLPEVLADCDFAWVASGTASLEAALVEVPMVVVYRLHPVSLAVGKAFVKLSHFSLPNILAGREVVPELLQNEVNGERLAEEAVRILEHPEARQAVQSELRHLRRMLGEPGAAERAAGAIVRDLEVGVR